MAAWRYEISLAALTREIFFNTRLKFLISLLPCNILYIYIRAILWSLTSGANPKGSVPREKVLRKGILYPLII